jgi:hypothetical protein
MAAQQRRYSGSAMSRKAGAGNIRLRSGSAGHKALENEVDEDEEHEPIEVMH